MPKKPKETSFEKTNWNHRYTHGGTLRNLRAGRSERPISSKHPIHLVLKANAVTIPGGLRSHKRFALISEICDRYARRFFVKVQKISVQGDHIHFIVRPARRTGLQHFLRVVAGQIAQRFGMEGLVKFAWSGRRVTDTPRKSVSSAKEANRQSRTPMKLWKHRPFTRVVIARSAFVTVANYVQLNEQEAKGVIPYRKNRLRGLKEHEWAVLWS